MPTIIFRGRTCSPTPGHELYPGMIEWIPPTAGRRRRRASIAGAARSTHSAARSASPSPTSFRRRRRVCSRVDAGLASGHGWCPVQAADLRVRSSLRNVHVIGDACIAGAMPKSASAAQSQARAMRAAIVAPLRGPRGAARNLDSVCYSLLDPKHRARHARTLHPHRGRRYARAPPGPGGAGAPLCRRSRGVVCGHPQELLRGLASTDRAAAQRGRPSNTLSSGGTTCPRRAVTGEDRDLRMKRRRVIQEPA